MSIFRNKSRHEEDAVEDVAEDAAEETIDETPATQYVTNEQLQTMLEGQAAQMRETLQTLLTPQAVPEPEPELQLPAEVSDDEIAQAFEEGEYKKAAKLQRQQRERDRLIHQHEMNQLRTESTTKISELVQHNATSELPYYKQFSKEIDTVLKTFPANVRGSKEVIKFVHDSVVGNNLDAVVDAKIAARDEAAKRQANLDPTDEPTGRRGMVARGEEDEELFTNQSTMALRSVGRSKEEFAKGMGYKDWDDYVRTAKKYEEADAHRWTTRR